MLDTKAIDQLAERLSALLPPGLNKAREDMQANVRDVLAQGLRRLDLVSREEFDVQTELLRRTEQRLAEMEQRVAALEPQPAKR